MEIIQRVTWCLLIDDAKGAQEDVLPLNLPATLRSLDAPRVTGVVQLAECAEAVAVSFIQSEAQTLEAGTAPVERLSLACIMELRAP